MARYFGLSKLFISQASCKKNLSASNLVLARLIIESFWLLGA